MDGSLTRTQYTPVNHTLDLLNALRENTLDKVKSLLQNGPPSRIDVTATFKGRNMIHLVIGTAKVSASKDKQIEISEIVELLCGRGVDVNATDHDKLRPIHYCAKTMNTEVAKCLLKHGADINSIDARGRTALWYMARCAQPDLKLAELLINNGGNLAKMSSFSLPLNSTIAQQRLSTLLTQKKLI